MLSQSEVDALISQIMAGGQTGTPAPRKAEESQRSRIRLYDFKRPDKFSRDQLRTIQMLHETMARQMATYLASKMRTMVQTFITSVDQMTYQEFLRGVSNPGMVGVLGMDPLKGNVLVEITPNIGFPMIDRMLGGPGRGISKARPVTEIEMTVLQKILGGMIGIIADAWRNVVELKPVLEGVETNPLFVQVIAPNEVVVVVAMEARIGDNAGAVNICIPYLCIEPLLPRLSAHQWFSSAQRGSSAQDVEALRRGLGDVPIALSVELGDAKITVGQLIDLEPGDVVELRQKATDEMRVLVDGRLKFLGYPGRSGKRLAVKISRAIGG